MNTSGIRPTGRRVLVLPEEIKTTTASGIMLTTGVNELRERMAQIEGVVIEVGEGCWDDQPSGAWAKAGDRVIFAKHAGLIYDKENTKDGKTYRLINDLDVVAIKE